MKCFFIIVTQLVHYGELSNELQKEYGQPPYYYWLNWNKNFPLLLIHTWQVLEGKVRNPLIKSKVLAYFK
jgi:Ribonuclease 2-5A